MSQIWRKIREGKDGSKQQRLDRKASFTSSAALPMHNTAPTAAPHSHQDEGGGGSSGAVSPPTAGLIPAGVEELFFPTLHGDISDPLLAQPQYVTRLQQVLDNPKTRRYFLSYLEAGESPQLLAMAAFWLDVQNLRQCGQEMMTVLADQASQDGQITDNLETDALNKLNHIQNTRNTLDDRPHDNLRINENELPLKMQSACERTNNQLNILPDLVSNINMNDGAINSVVLDRNLNSFSTKCDSSAVNSGATCSCDSNGKKCGHSTDGSSLNCRHTQQCGTNETCDNNRVKHRENISDDINSSTLKTSPKINCKNVANQNKSSTNSDDDEFGEFCSVPLDCYSNQNTSECQPDPASDTATTAIIADANANPPMSSMTEKFEPDGPSVPTTNLPNNSDTNDKSSNAKHERINSDMSNMSVDGINDMTTGTTLYNNMKQHLVKEVWRIFERYIAVDADYNCPISDTVKKRVMDNINRIHIQFDPECFTEAQQEAFLVLESEVGGFLSSEFHLQHQLDLLFHSSTTLPDVLHSQVAFPYFMEYLEQESGRPLLEFWMTATNFRNQLKSGSALTTNSSQDTCSSTGGQQPSSAVPSSSSSASFTSQQQKQQLQAQESRALSVNSSPSNPPQAAGQQSQDDAMVLYDKYFSLQASQRIGFSDALRGHIESNICQESGPNHTCFDVALRVVLHTLATRYLPGYLCSSLFQGYVSDLLASVRISGHGGRRRTVSGSTCGSSDVGGTAATSNTLLATETSTGAKGQARERRAAAGGGVIPDAATNMRIDDRQIKDPDSLWRRKNFSRLSCGSMTPLGRFESDLLLESAAAPGRGRADTAGSGGGRITRTLRRLANRDEDKARLEYAYSQAEVLVSEVTRVTLAPGNSPANPYSRNNPYDLANQHSAAPHDCAQLPSSCCNTQAQSSYTVGYTGVYGPSSGGLSDQLARGAGGGGAVIPPSNHYYSSNTNLSSMSAASSSSDLHLSNASSQLHSPSKSVKSMTMSKSMSSSNHFSEFTDSLFGLGSHGLAHSYSLASFDLGTDIDSDFQRGLNAAAVAARSASNTNVKH